MAAARGTGPLPAPRLQNYPEDGTRGSDARGAGLLAVNSRSLRTLAGIATTICVQLHAEPDRGLFGDGAGRVRIGAGMGCGVGGGASLLLTTRGAGGAWRAEEIAAAWRLRR